MSTSNTVGGVLGALAAANGYVSLAVTVGSAIVPLGKMLIKEIRSIGGETEQTYEVVLQTGQVDLDYVIKLSESDLTEINAELTRLGQPTIQPGI